jgi:hypothetical protein
LTVLNTEDVGWFVTLVGAGWAVVMFLRDRISLTHERSSAMVARLLESDRIIMEHPEIQRYISRTTKSNDRYFYDDKVLKDDTFYKAKSFVYWQLNLFDELLSISPKSSNIAVKFFHWCLNPGITEYEDWQRYIRYKLMHPLYRSILDREEDLFGRSLIKFWRKNKNSIVGKPNPHKW